MPQTTILVYQTAAKYRPLMKWLDDLEELEPKAYIKCLERIQQLERFGSELRRPAADSLRDGIHELRAKLGKVQYRILYFFCGKNIACLSHGLTKEGAVPPADIDEAIQVKRLVQSDPKKYTAEWEL